MSFDLIVAKCATAGEELARDRAKRGDLRALLLWYRSGELRLAATSPGEGWKLAPEQGKGLDASVPYARYASWVRDKAASLPIYEAPE